MTKPNNKSLQRSNKHKLFLIKHLGGKCQTCGYKKCIAALTFHHIDPNLKNFSISQKLSKSLPALIEEANKCILLCNNCHAELHAKEYHFSSLENESILNDITLETRRKKYNNCLNCSRKCRYTRFYSEICKFKFKEKNKSIQFILDALNESKNFHEAAKKAHTTIPTMNLKLQKYNPLLYYTYRIYYNNEEVGFCKLCSNVIIKKNKIKKFCSRKCYFTNLKQKKLEVSKKLSEKNKNRVPTNKRLNINEIESLISIHKYNYSKVANILNCTPNAIKKRLKKENPILFQTINKNKHPYTKIKCKYCHKLFRTKFGKNIYCSKLCHNQDRNHNYYKNINSIIKLQSEGLNKSEIARKLSIDRKSVESYIKKHDNEISFLNKKQKKMT